MWRLSWLLVASLLLSASVARAEDWPQFRGPTGEGLSDATNVPVEWDATKNVVWKKEIAGQGWSSPAVVGERVYVTAAVPLGDGAAGYSLRAICLAASNGSEVWNHEIFNQPGDAPGIHTKNSHASPTPLVSGDRIYVHFGHQGTACLDLDGKPLWKNADIDYAPVHGNGGSPVLVDDRLIFSCDGGSDPFVIGLNAATGEVAWKTPRNVETSKSFSFSTPLVIDVDGQKQVVSPASNIVAAYEPASGKELWRFRYDGYSVIPCPVFGHGLIFVSTGYDSPTLLAIRAGGSGDITDTHLAWSIRKGAPSTPSPLLVGDELYLVSDGGVASCLDAKTGDSHWQERLGGNFSASPIAAEGRVYFQSEDGVGFVVRASQEHEQLAENPLGERTLASYAAADGALYIRSDKHLFKIGGK